MGNYDQYLNAKQDLNLLKRFAFLGTRESFDNKLKYLTKISEPEQWYFDENLDDSLSVIFYYFVHTFDRCYKQGKIIIKDDESLACFNTGLMTPQGDEIFAIFDAAPGYNPENPFSNYWYFKKVVTENERYFVSSGLRKPEMATYFDNYNELYFDPSLPINVNFDHIFDDNIKRLPDDFKLLGKDVARQVFDGFLGHTKKRIKRNNRIPVPQFYKDKIMFLIPVEGLNKATMVIALEEVEGQYIANTILTLPMAYNCARLLTKPESNWLLIAPCK